MRVEQSEPYCTADFAGNPRRSVAIYDTRPDNNHSFRGSSCSCASAWPYSRQQYLLVFGQERPIPSLLMTFTAIFVIGLDISVVMDRTVGQCRLQCCRMAVTIYHGLTKLFPPIGQHLHQTIASTIALIIQWPMSLIRGVNQYGVKHL